MRARRSEKRWSTVSERETVRLALQGLSNEEIAEIRQRKARTVANQLQSAYRKLGINSRAGLHAVIFDDEVAESGVRLPGSADSDPQTSTG